MRNLGREQIIKSTNKCAKMYFFFKTLKPEEIHCCLGYSIFQGQWQLCYRDFSLFP